MISSILRDAIDRVLTEAQALGIDPVLIGAQASGIAAESAGGLPAARRTNDADLALPAASWDIFRRMKVRLAAAGFAPDPRIEHRLRFQGSTVDLLPFGPAITSPDGTIRWPDSGFEMSVTGFAEACARSVPPPPAAGVSVRCVSVPGLALLKAIAFTDRVRRGDRRHENDAQDLLYWWKHYAAVAGEKRVYDLPEAGLPDIVYTSAGAALLGLDTAALASAEADAAVRRFFNLAGEPYGAFRNALVSPALDEEGAEREWTGILDLLRAFRAGYEIGRSKPLRG